MQEGGNKDKNGPNLIYESPSAYTIKVVRWCLGIAFLFGVLAVILNEFGHYVSILEFLTGTWPGTQYGNLFESQNRWLLFSGVFLRICAISLVTILLGALAARFLRREFMRVTDVIFSRDELIKAKLRATFYRRLEDQIDAKLPDLIDDALETGFKQAHEEWVKYIETRSKLGKDFLEHKV